MLRLGSIYCPASAVRPLKKVQRCHPKEGLKRETLFNANMLWAKRPIDWGPLFNPKYKTIVVAVEYFI